MFAGQTDDPFFLDLRVFDLLYGGNLSETGIDSLAGFNVHSIAIQVPKSVAQRRQPDHRRLGDRQPSGDDDARRPASETSTGNFVQVSRLGMPLVNEVVLPVGQKDKWNGSIADRRRAVPQLRDRSRSAEAAAS